MSTNVSLRLRWVSFDFTTFAIECYTGKKYQPKKTHTHTKFISILFLCKHILFYFLFQKFRKYFHEFWVNRIKMFEVKINLLYVRALTKVRITNFMRELSSPVKYIRKTQYTTFESSVFHFLIWCIACLLMTRKTRNKNTVVRKMNCGIKYIKKCARCEYLLEIHIRVYLSVWVCESQIKMNDSYENRNWQANDVVLCRPHIILVDLIPSFGCILYTTLGAQDNVWCVCDRRLFSVYFLLWVCHGWSCHNSKISFLPKRMHSVMCKDTDWRGIQRIQQLQQKIKTSKQTTKAKNTQTKNEKKTYPSQNKWIQIKYIHSQATLEKYDTVNRMRFTFWVHLVIFRSSHRMGSQTFNTYV